MHLRGVFEAVQPNGNGGDSWVRPIVVLCKPHDKIWVCQNITRAPALTGHAQVTLTRDQDVRLADERAEEARMQSPVAGSVTVGVNDWYLSIRVCACGCVLLKCARVPTTTKNGFMCEVLTDRWQILCCQRRVSYPHIVLPKVIIWPRINIVTHVPKHRWAYKIGKITTSVIGDGRIAPRFVFIGPLARRMIYHCPRLDRARCGEIQGTTLN